jgi:hypothetical protein
MGPPDAGSLDAGTDAMLEPPDACADASCENAAVPAALVEHACLHARSGPFRDLVLVAAREAVDVSRAHTAFRVQLFQGDAAVAEGLVRYMVRTSGSYALFTHPLVDVTVAAPPVSRVVDTSTTTCAELPWVSTFTFFEGEHLLRLRATQPNVVLVFELVEGA